MHRYVAASILLLGTSCVAADDKCQPEPGRAALAFYEVHQDFIFTGALSPPLSARFSRAIVENLEEQKRTGGIGLIDWNYWTDAQDGEQSATAQLGVVAMNGERAQVTLAYEFQLSPGEKPKPRRAVVKLVRTGQGCWLVDDLLRGKRSVRSYLQPLQRRATPPK